MSDYIEETENKSIPLVASWAAAAMVYTTCLESGSDSSAKRAAAEELVKMGDQLDQCQAALKEERAQPERPECFTELIDYIIQQLRSSAPSFELFHKQAQSFIDDLQSEVWQNTEDTF